MGLNWSRVRPNRWADELAGSDEVRLDMDFQPGDTQNHPRPSDTPRSHPLRGLPGTGAQASPAAALAGAGQRSSAPARDGRAVRQH